MAEPSPVPNVIVVVHVVCDPVELTLSVQPPAQPIYSGDLVLWDFINLPAGWTPWIHFHERTDGSFRGPFEDTRQNPTAVWGRTAVADTTLFQYNAVIRRGDQLGQGSAMVTSPTASLEVRALNTTRNAAPAFTVTYRPPDEQHPGGWLEVTPDVQVLHAGDVISWQVVDLPEVPGGWRPLVTFAASSPAAGQYPVHFGPFTELIYQAGLLTGKGNNNVQGTYPFTFQVIRALDGALLWVSSADPAIDNRGEATPPG